MMRNRFPRPSFTASVLVMAAIMSNWAMARDAGVRDDSLWQGFLSPPDTAKPRVWWDWMNGNISKEGIQLDLEWMYRVGIGGAQIFDASIDTPAVVSPRLVFMTPPWKAAFHSAAALANGLGLELAIAGSPGFSESGGPWVTPEDGMKKLVWSETRIAGATVFDARLPQPPRTVGPFQNVPVDRSIAAGGGSAPAEPVPETYHDIAILAYRLAEADVSMDALHPMVTSSAGQIDAHVLWDEDFTTGVRLPVAKGEQPAWIRFDFGAPQTLQTMSLALQGLNNTWGVHRLDAELESSADGVTFTHVAVTYDTADVPFGYLPPLQETITFSPVSARYFRVVLPTPPLAGVGAAWEEFMGGVPTELNVTELKLYPTPRIHHFEHKAAYFLDAGLDNHPTLHVPPDQAIPPDTIIDLTSRLRADGTLQWTAPAGRWAILRLGYSLTGVTNEAASSEGTGLEVDKLNRLAVKAHIDNYLERYEAMLGPELMGAHGLRAMVNDSYEAGPQNWTLDLPEQFARRRGYDLKRWLPALTGRIIGSAEDSDRFLWDFRRTLTELMADNHYGQIAASLHERGLLHYGEAHEISRAFIGDGMDAKRDVDVPMGAMWMPGFVISQERGDADIRESASVAHLYGQNRVAAESMTAFGVAGTAFAFAPEDLKATVDRELTDGLNLFVVHTSAHQPLENPGPGIGLGPFGQWFTRHETWAEQARPWVSYLARSSYLLQQGRFVADIVYYYGQDSNITALYPDHLPPIPEGYAFDFASAHALTKLSVQNSNLVTASGMRYRVLALDPRTRTMSLDVLKTIERLVEAGATVVGDKPQTTPSLADNVAEFSALTDALWGLGDVGEHRYGAGRILCGISPADAVTQLRLRPDFSYSTLHAGTRVRFVHRHLGDGDLYFVNNTQDRSEEIVARFRVGGKAPELWHADSGAQEPASYRQQGDETIVPLKLDPHDAVFVVFRADARQPQRQVPEPTRKALGTIAGPWTVRFQSGRGAPQQATFAELTSWTMNSDPGIRYFSGTARYETSFKVPDSWRIKRQRVELDLGTLKNLAEVLVNGRPAGTLWKPPFRTDVTGMLHPGVNHLIIRITNLWPNRLIGDKQLNAVPVALTTFNPYRADSPLLESGLIGPVALLALKNTYKARRRASDLSMNSP